VSRGTRIALVVGVLAVVVTIGLIVVGVQQSMRESCEVCITFRGRTACREAVGATIEEATRTATDNACAFLAGGMTDSVACQNTPPDEVTCRE
jgi:hypothetical protein